jgi:V/A-type H+-transporting ATPase subunit C
MSYSGLTTKIRAMQSRFLRDENFREIVELPNVPAAVAYLKQKPSYAEILNSTGDAELHRGDIEKILRQSVYHDFAKLYSFASLKQRQFLSMYFMRYEVYFLKVCLTNIFDHRNVPLDLSAFEAFFTKHSRLNFQLLTTSRTPEEFCANLKGSGYYEPLASISKNLERPTLFDYEMTLDLFYFQLLWKNREKIVGKNEAKSLSKILGSKFDMLNIQWIYRCKKYYHMDSAGIYALLIPVNYHIRPRQISEMVEAEDTGALENLISQTYYAKHFRDFTEDNLEPMYASILKHILSSGSRQEPYSVTTVYSYLYHKEHEVDRLIIALECVRYQVSPEEAMKHVACR